MPGPHENKKRGFRGFCLDEFEDACLTGADTCPDWQRCYDTLHALEDGPKPKMIDKGVIIVDLRKGSPRLKGDS